MTVARDDDSGTWEGPSGGGEVPPIGGAPDRGAPDREVVLARAAWSRLVEPGDLVAGALVEALGPVEAWEWVRAALDRGRADGGPQEGLGQQARAQLDRALGGWAARWDGVDPRRDVDGIVRLGGRVLVPEDPGWPASLDDLGPATPACLWQLGEAPLVRLVDRSVAVIGARACTSYGERVAAEIVGGLVDAGWTVVSGGAYGIDAVAHRAALAAGGRTVAVLAGGLDRPYPAGNVRLLAAATQEGALISEVPLGSVPSRTRFLQRNRLIAALTRATVVVEAAWRSGALSTAGHAAGLLRPVGAVPGPVTSAASAGCHRLLRDGAAVCVTDAAEVLELAGGRPAPEPILDLAPGDGMGPMARRVLDALPLRSGVPAEALTRPAGLALGDLLACLGRLELAGFAVQHDGRWRRSSRGAHDGHEPSSATAVGPARPDDG